jgi:hypothetical protein
MATYKITGDNINIKKRHFSLMILVPAIIGSIIIQTGIFFMLNNYKVFLISLSLYIVITFLVLLFCIKKTLKILSQSLSSIFYNIEDEHLIIMQNNYERYNISKDDIKCINRYKNNAIVIVLKNNKKIHVNKYLENYNELIKELNSFSTITEINKNQNITLNIISGIFAVIVMCIFLWSNNIVLVIVSSVLVFSFCAYLFQQLKTKK